MHAPLYSTIALLAELIVSSAIFYTIYQGYKRNKLPEKVAIGALVYEILFDISYMIFRLPARENGANKSLLTGLGIFHGTLSLIMFASLIAFFVLAIKNYRRNVNYFRVHKRLTFAFLFLWSISVLSGVALYFVEDLF
jgi:uncharacterized membrane protein YozB (DUF420 family)